MKIRQLGLVFACMVSLGTTSPVWAEQGASSSVIYPIFVEGKWGFISEAGDAIAQPSYDSLKRLRFTIPGCNDLKYASSVLGEDGPVPVAIFSGAAGLKWGFVGPFGEIVSPIYDEAYSYHAGVAAVSSDGKWGFIDTTGEEVITFKYDYASDFRDGVAVVMVDGWWGLLNREGEYIVEPKYDVIRSMSYGPYFMFETRGKQGVIDAEGDVIVEAMFDRVHVLSDGLLSVTQNGVSGYYNVEAQRFQIEPMFDVAAPFDSGLAYVKTDQLVGFIDRDGDFVFEPMQSEKRPRADFMIYEYAPSETTSIRRYRIQPRRELEWGLIDAADGTVIIEPQYESIGQIVEGLALFRAGGLTGYLNAKGEVVIPPKFTQAFDFSEGLAYVRSSDRSGYIDTEGQFVIDFADKRIVGSPFRPNLAFIFGDGRERYINRDGNEVYSFKSGCN